MFKRILVPVDLTDKNRRALAIALALAKQNRASVTLLHVIELVNHVRGGELKGFYATLERSAQQKMAAFAKAFLRARVPSSQVAVYGNRALEIARYAMDHRASLIVMSSHAPKGGGWAEDWGTISYKVALLAACPILLVK